MFILIAQVEREINIVSKHTGLKPWMVFAIVAVVVLLVLLGIGVCVWRFCRYIDLFFFYSAQKDHMDKGWEMGLLSFCGGSKVFE